MASLEQRIASHRIIGLDTSVFIYHFEAHPQYLPLTRVILTQIQAGQCRGIASTIALMELTVQPWRLSRADIARQYEVLLINFPNLKLSDVTREVARQAAQLRARYNLRPADALQVATAMIEGATLWVSNDKQLKRIEPAIEVTILDEYVEP
ncbi:MAG: PIN domain-containing protein [Chloroflexota bacterium]